jgi:hypothetical protein
MGDAAGYPSEGWVVWTFLFEQPGRKRVFQQPAKGKDSGDDTKAETAGQEISDVSGNRWDGPQGLLVFPNQ